MRNNITSPVTGSDFYGRERELKEAMRLLESNQSILLSAPRRIGKSSLAMKIKRLLDEKGVRNVYIDLEGVETQEDFLKKLLEHFDRSALWKTKGTESLRKLIAGVKGIGPVKLDFKDERSVSDLYYQIAEAIDHDKETVVIIDELTLFLTFREKEGGSLNGVSFLLNWLRSLRQVADTKIRWLFSGSIGLHHFTGIRNLSYSINDIAPVQLGPLRSEEVRGLLDALVESLDLRMERPAREYLLSKLGWPVPYLLQLMVNRIVNLAENEEVTESTVDAAFDALAASNILKIWRERLVEYNGFEKIAEFVLRELSQTAEGKPKEELYRLYREREGLPDSLDNEFKFSEALNLLEDDGYLCREADRRKFCSPLIRSWWRYHFA